MWIKNKEKIKFAVQPTRIVEPIKYFCGKNEQNDEITNLS